MTVMLNCYGKLRPKREDGTYLIGPRVYNRYGEVIGISCHHAAGPPGKNAHELPAAEIIELLNLMLITDIEGTQYKLEKEGMTMDERTKGRLDAYAHILRWLEEVC